MCSFFSKLTNEEKMMKQFLLYQNIFMFSKLCINMYSFKVKKFLLKSWQNKSFTVDNVFNICYYIL